MSNNIQMLSYRIAIILMLSFAGTTTLAQWKGHIKRVTKTTGEFIKREVVVELFFTNAIPTLHRYDGDTEQNYTDDKGTGTSSDHVETNMGNCDCSGSGASQLHEIVIDKDDGTYSISAFGLFPCLGGDGSDGSCG